MQLKSLFIDRLFICLVPKRGIEPPTHALRMRCSANWATSALTNYRAISFSTILTNALSSAFHASQIARPWDSYVALTHSLPGVRPSGNLRLSKFNPVEFVNGEKIRQVSLSSFRLTYYGTGFPDWNKWHLMYFTRKAKNPVSVHYGAINWWKKSNLINDAPYLTGNCKKCVICFLSGWWHQYL